jgi:carboxyl-terminal processing protease
MKNSLRGENKGIKNKTLRMFLGGLFGVLLVGFVFFAGIKVGEGEWTVGVKKPVSSNQGLPENLDYTSVEEVYDALRRKYDGKLDLDKLMTGLKTGLVDAAGDPYTTYLDAESAKAFNEQLNGSFSGIGAELSKDGSNIIVVSPIAGFPAEKAGLKSKDIIVSIDGQDATGLSVDEAVKRIRGEAGTSVKLGIVRGDERKELTITREVITIPSVETKTLDGNICYIRITRFAEDTPGLVEKASTDCKNAGAKGVVLDMRGNPGGYLNGAVDVSETWLKEGQTILQEKRDGKVIQSFEAKTTGIFNGLPTVVLINEGSASASEITAGALKDNKAAQIVGVTSFGKGSVQEFSTFSAGDVLKVTVARWFTPAGKNIDKEGIEPNVKVELTEADAKAGIDTQLNKALEILKTP